jgi:hypothetical protein
MEFMMESHDIALASLLDKVQTHMIDWTRPNRTKSWVSKIDV